jgi:hypothetical protein
MMLPFDKDPARRKRYLAAVGPQIIDTLLRKSLTHAWMCLPEKHRSPTEVERMVREIFERAVKDFNSDFARFSDSGSATKRTRGLKRRRR